MKSQSTNPLPKTLPGVVLPQFVRCGKANCKCSSGAPQDRHGPYYYRFWREAGRLRKQYVRRDQLAQTVAACARRQAERAQAKELEVAALEQFRALREQVRQLEQQGLLIRTGPNTWTGAAG